MKRYLLLIGLVSILLFTNRSYAKCEANTSTATRVAKMAISTLYNVFPIKIGSVTIANFKDLEDTDTVSNAPICTCVDPIPRIGIKVSFWEPIALVEVVKQPWCSPTAGMLIPVNTVTSVTAVGTDTGQTGSDTNKMASLQAHWIKFPVFALLNILADFICLSSEPFTVAYMTEVDILWQNDIWASLLGPEAFLFANPIAQMACLVDAVAATLGFPLDPLFWCMGAWQTTYPMSKNISGTIDATANLTVVGRLAMKLHRQFLLYGSVGAPGLCGLFPMPVWRKSQYGTFPVYPIAYPLRIPIGRSDILWASGLDVPGVNLHNWVNALYRKRDCCAL